MDLVRSTFTSQAKLYKSKTELDTNIPSGYTLGAMYWHQDDEVRQTVFDNEGEPVAILVTNLGQSLGESVRVLSALEADEGEG